MPISLLLLVLRGRMVGVARGVGHILLTTITRAWPGIRLYLGELVSLNRPSRFLT